MSEKPDLFNNPEGYMETLEENLSSDIINRASLQARQFGLKPKTSPHYLEVTVTRMNKKGVVDLKPYFQASKYAKKKKGSNGWYMVIPMRQKTAGMSSAMYRQASAINIPTSTNSATGVVQLMSTKISTSSSISSANYKPVSNNITRIRQGKKSTYYAFRTVSDKTNPAAWILNRSKINDDNFSKTMIANMDRLFKQLVKKVGG